MPPEYIKRPKTQSACVCVCLGWGSGARGERGAQEGFPEEDKT